MTADVIQTSDRTARRLLIVAVLVSLGLHGLLVPPVARWLQAERTSPDDAAPLPTEVVLPLADWIITESAPLGQESAPDEAAPEEEIDERELGYIRTTVPQESLTSPDQPAFVSDRNTVAQSERPGDGSNATPNIDGKRQDSIQVEDQRFRDGLSIDESPTNIKTKPTTPGSLASSEQQPTTEPQEPTKTQAQTTNEISEPLPEILDAIPLPKTQAQLHPELLQGEIDSQPTDDVAEAPIEMEEVTEQSELAAEAAPPGAPTLPVTPAPSTLPVPDRDVEAFQSETPKAKLDGGAAKKGYTAFDAEDTPIGRYRKEVSDTIERSWQAKMLASQDFFGFNVKIRVEFSLNKWGKVSNLRVRKRAKNAVLTNQTLAAILEAKLPAMPPIVIEQLDGGNLPCHFNFIIY